MRHHALAGGYSSAGVRGIDLDIGGEPLTVVLKRGSAAEVAAMRALAVVHGVDRPRLITAGQDEFGPWFLTPAYAGMSLAAGVAVPAAVWETLARVHAHWLRRRPRGLPVLTARWWSQLCLHRIAPAVQAAAERSPDVRLDSAAQTVTAWAREPRMLAALALLPRTLVHGDPHRGNILHCADGATIIDWGNAKVAPAGLDLAVIRAQGGADSGSYRNLVAALTDPAGNLHPGQREVERHWADVHVHVAYLGFAADHLGAARVGEMIDTASDALSRLGDALSDLR